MLFALLLLFRFTNSSWASKWFVAQLIWWKCSILIDAHQFRNVKGIVVVLLDHVNISKRCSHTCADIYLWHLNIYTICNDEKHQFHYFIEILLLQKVVYPIEQLHKLPFSLKKNTPLNKQNFIESFRLYLLWFLT